MKKTELIKLRDEKGSFIIQVVAPSTGAVIDAEIMYGHKESAGYLSGLSKFDKLSKEDFFDLRDLLIDMCEVLEGMND